MTAPDAVPTSPEVGGLDDLTERDFIDNARDLLRGRGHRDMRRSDTGRLWDEVVTPLLARAREAARAETAERIAVAIETQRESWASAAYRDALQVAARIARAEGTTDPARASRPHPIPAAAGDDEGGGR